MKHALYLLLFLSTFFSGFAHDNTIDGHISDGTDPIPFAYVKATMADSSFKTSVMADENGYYILGGLPSGNLKLEFSAMGFLVEKKELSLGHEQTLHLEITLVEDILTLETTVITATRSDVRKQDAPALVQVVDKKTIEQTNSQNLAEAITFQPGVRLENNCQNCGFSQVRMNGLDGPYSQILIDGRPIFSALNGVYGLDQIPASMIERIEVVRGGGSALYGANAIAGTINIITRDPLYNEYSISTNSALIGGKTPDHALNLNGSVVDKDLKSGISFFGSFRNRQPFDANDDGFSEITLLENNTFGIKGFYKPKKGHRFGIELHSMNEFRRGGNLFERPAHLTDVTEQLDHQVFGGQLTYDLESKNERNHLNTYLSAQHTKRGSYYGGGGNVDWSQAQTLQDSLDFYQQTSEASNFYGNTTDLTLVGGIQFSHDYPKFLKGDANLTTGIESNYNDVVDEMPGYGRAIDQSVFTTGVYGQFSFVPLKKTTVLVGLRSDNVFINGNYSFVGDETQTTDLFLPAINPRLNLKHDLNDHLSLRAGYGRGFRAPHAFNEDLHIATVGGEAQFIRLSKDLKQESSDSYTASITYTNTEKKTQMLLTLDGFYTVLHNPFVNEYLPESQQQENFALLEKRNGDGAKVAGLNLEASIAPSKKWQFQFATTIQQSTYNEEEVVFENENGEQVTTKNLLRSPNVYGYVTTNWKPIKPLQVSLSGVYTGSMLTPHILPEETILVTTRDFMEFNLRLAYTIKVGKEHKVQLSTGVQNIFNAYQDDFDSGAERDATYVYGPTRPRTFFVGLKLGNF